MKAAITGGSGVVGRALVRHLVEAGHEVEALARSDEAENVVASLGANPVRGDVLDPDSLRGLVAEADVVFHVAGVNEMCTRDASAMYLVNVEGTKNALRASSDARVRRFVHTSSAATIGDRDGEVGSETTVHRGDYLSRYEYTKCVAEQVALAASGELDVVVVNPSSVQGPGRATGSARLILDVVTGRLKILADSEVSFVDIDDCAHGHLLAAEKGRRGERYILSGATVGMRDAVCMLESAIGHPLSVRYAPRWMISPAGAVLEVFGRMTNKEPPICRESAKVILAGARYDGSKASHELGLHYRPLEETLHRTVDWFRQEHLA